MNFDKCPTCGQDTDLATNEQRKRFFALVALIIEKLLETSKVRWTKEEVSDHLKMKFLGGKERTTKSGKNIIVLQSLSSIKKTPMSEFLTACEAFASEKWGIWLDE